MLAASCAPTVVERAPTRGDAPSTIVWVLDHGWHTALAVRRADVDRAVWPDVDDLPEAEFIEVAWGDRGFYMATSPPAWLAVTAALNTSGSVLHVAAIATPLATAFPSADIVELRLVPAGFAALTRFVADEYARDDASRPIRLARGLYGPSWFYAARSRYHLFNTCNTWVARALQHGGVPVHPAGTVTAASLMQQVRDAARVWP